MLPQASLRCKNCAERPRRIPFVYKRASCGVPLALRCTLSEQRPRQNEVLCGTPEFSPGGPLDSVSVRAQHRSYTNKWSTRPEVGAIVAFSTAGLFMTD